VEAIAINSRLVSLSRYTRPSRHSALVAESGQNILAFPYKLFRAYVTPQPIRRHLFFGSGKFSFSKPRKINPSGLASHCAKFAVLFFFVI